jgi:cytochrome c biogenesis factor
VQPLTNSTGWLFVSQGRARDMTKWGMISGTLITLSFVVGLRWGAVGVAIAYSICMIAVICPLLFHLVGRTGPINARMLYRALAMPLLAATVVMLAIGTLRRWLDIHDPKIGLIVSAAIALAATLMTYAACSPGRLVLTEVLKMLARRGSTASHAPVSTTLPG